MPGIFVSYRRSDSQGEAGRLFDDLVEHFGEQTVFMDVAAIEVGRDFRKAIEDGVTKCDVLLVIIGTEWLDAKDQHGVRRLTDPLDYVRIETSFALKRDIRVIPVLVRGAKMPNAEQLPEELKELAYRNCIELTHTRWRSDVQILTEALRRVLGETSQTVAGRASNATTGSMRPAPSPHDHAAPSKTDGSASAHIDPAALLRVTRQLALRIGPIADIVVKRAASEGHSLDELYQKVAEEIDSPVEREKFLRERTGTPSAISPRAATPTSAVSQPVASRTPAPPMQLETHEQPHREVSTSAPRSRPSSRPNYWLYAVAGVAVLLPAFLYVTHFSSKREAGPSQQGQSLQPATVVPVDNKTVTPPPAGGTGKSLVALSKRVHLTEEQSNSLRISTASLTYPALARQARIEGQVVLAADISKEGTVESLKLIKGHPTLVPAAMDAAKQFRYKPYLQNGEPVPVNTQITVNFHLTNKAN